MVYVDTSALAKWYLNETQSEAFAAWIQTAPDPRISTLTIVEMDCLISRRRRAGQVSAQVARRIQTAFEDDIGRGVLLVHPVEDAHLLGARSLMRTLSRHPLRALDALHLQIARAQRLPEIATADAIMGQAATALGMRVASFN